MRTPAYILLFYLLFGSSFLSACSCYSYDTFCAMAGDYLHETWGPAQIITARPLRVYDFNPFSPSEESFQPLFDVVVTRSLRGDLAAPGDTITFILQNGVNCAVWENDIDTISEQLFFFRGLGDGGYDLDNDSVSDTIMSPHGVTTLGNCGPTFLPLIDGTVYGPIAPGIDSMALDAFVADEYLCVAAPLESEIECNRQSTGVCEQLTELAAGIDPLNLNIVRLELLASRFTSSWRGRRALMADFRITQQETGNLSRSGDTISVILRPDNRCVPYNNSFEYQPRPDFTYLYYFKALDTTGGLELDGYESKMSPYPVTEAHRDVQSFVSVRSDSVSVGSSGNRMLVPYADFAAELKACANLVSNRPVGIATDLRVLPNPATERLVVAWAGAATAIDLLDITGRVHLHTASVGLRDGHTFDVSNLPPGVYVLRLATVEGIATRKVVVR